MLLFLITLCLACGIIAQNTCLSQDKLWCFRDFANQRYSPCSVGCWKCSDPDTCIECAPLNCLNENKQCQIQSNVGHQCATCTYDGRCTSCPSGYYLHQTHCLPCDSLCKTCSGPSICKSCISGEVFGLYLSASDNTCNYCPDGCSACNSSEFCTSCNFGYVLKNFQCISCTAIDSECTSCDETQTNCTACTVGHYLFNNACMECSSGCSNCTDDSNCQKCSDGYYLNANYGCTSCAANCQKCQNAATCSQCWDGYTFDSARGSCLLCHLDCNPTPELFMSVLPNNVLEPDIWRPPKRLAANVTSEETETETKNSETETETPAPETETTSPRILSPGTIAQNACLSSCVSGCFFDFANQQCRACPAKCNDCSDPYTCIKCAPGFYLNEHKHCVNCEVRGCAACSKQGVCATCQSGYYLHNSSSCQPCDYLCETCSGPSTCKSCVATIATSDGYSAVYLSARSKICHECPYACSACNSSQFCTSCIVGYVLKNFQCVSCAVVDDVCASCDENRINCTACAYGKTLFNNTCFYHDLPFCRKSADEDGSTCLECRDGFYLNANNECAPCTANCQKCQNLTTCSQCWDDYTFDFASGRCLSCTCYP